MTFGPPVRMVTSLLRLAIPAAIALYFLAISSWSVNAEAPQIESTVLLDGLKNPCGIAVQPGTGQVFVSNSGAGQVVRLNPQSPGKVDVVILGFELDPFSKGPDYQVGPLGLLFLSEQVLIVGGGDQPKGKELIRAYEIPAAGSPRKVEETLWTVGPLPAGPDSATGEGDFYALAIDGKGGLFATCSGDESKGWLARATLTETGAENLKPFIATKEVSGAEGPVAIAAGPAGELAVGQRGKLNVSGDSRLAFYSAKTGQLLAKSKTGLHNLCDLKYSPTGKLYALDASWADPNQGGLYRLDQAADGVKATRLMQLDKPSAMAFGSEGVIFVTVFGTAHKDPAGAQPASAGSGAVLKLTGEF